MGPDFRNAPKRPYFPDLKDVCKEGKARLLEVPMTITYQNALLRRCHPLRNSVSRYRKSIPLRLLAKFTPLDPAWLRPYPHMSADDLIGVTLTEQRQGSEVLEMMLHSSELLPGASPYNPDQASVERLFAKLESLFGHLRRTGHTGLTLSQVAARYRDAG
jgi:hypothetical protein